MDRCLLAEGKGDLEDNLSVLKEIGRIHWIGIEHMKDNARKSFKEGGASLAEWLAAFAD